MSTRTASLLGGLGRTLIVTGVLVLAFAGFQLWGTSVAEARAQSSLDSEFNQMLDNAQNILEAPDASDTRGQSESAESESDDPTAASASPDPSGATGSDSDNSNPGESETEQSSLPQLTEEQLPAEGAAAGKMHIPAIGVTKTFVEGVSRDVLRLGPGHYPSTPFPGQPGNAAIAGHRTTHGAPFFDIDKLVPGDEILVETLQGEFTYIVEGHDNGNGGQLGHFIVAPTNVGVIADQGDNRITLTACHPKYSAQQRIIVTAILASEVAPANPPSSFNENQLGADAVADADRLGVDEIESQNSAEDDGEDDAGTNVGSNDSDGGVTGRELANTVADSDGITESLGWQPEHAKPTAIWGAVTALVALFAWVVGRAWRRWPAYIVASPAVLASLFFCFSHLDKFIPAV